MKKRICFLLITAIVFSSCSVSYFGTSYGRVKKNCPMANPTAYFYKKGTGKSFVPRNVFLKRNKL